MDQVSFVSVNTASQYRSNRIPQPLWNEHKADIVREYRRGGRQGVARVLQWLEEQHIPGLAPTRPQLEYQLKKKWQLDNTIEPLDNNVEPVSYTVQHASAVDFSPGTGVLGSPDDLTATSTIVPESDTPSSAQAEPTWSPLSSVTFQPVGSASTIDKGKRKEVSTESQVEPSQKRLKNAEVDEYTDMFPTFAHSPVLSAYLEEPWLSITEIQDRPTSHNHVFQGVARHRSTIPGSDITEVEATNSTSRHSPLIDPKRVLTILELMDIKWSSDQVYCILTKKQPPDLVTASELTWIAQAAELCFDVGYIELALPLYLILWLLQEDLPRWQTLCSLSHLTECGIISNKADLVVVRDLLVQEISKVEKQSAIFELFALRLLLATVYQQFKDTRECESQLRKAKWIFPDLETYITHVKSDQDMELNLFLYCFAYNAFLFLEEKGGKIPSVMFRVSNTLTDSFERTFDLPLNWLKSRLLQQNPGPFALHDGRLQNTCLRDGLTWCQNLFAAASQPASELASDWKQIRQQYIDMKRADFVCIFSLLWIQMDLGTDLNLIISDFGTEGLEMIMGMAPTKFLSEMASLILETSTLVKPPRLIRRFISKDQALLRRAKSGVHNLSKQTDEELSRLFLSHIARDVMGYYRYSTGPKPGILSRAAGETFVADTKESTGHHMFPNQFPSRMFSIMLNPGFNSTFASSLSSSTFSSMRRLAVGISSRSRPSSILTTSSRTGRTPTVDELSDRMSILTLPASVFD